MERFTFTLSAGCPITLGSPLRTAASAWGNWGINWSTELEYASLCQHSRQAYLHEWEHSSTVGLLDISRAATEAGLSDCNRLLNAGVAEDAGDFITNADSLTILDVGAGTGDTSTALLAAHPSLVGRASWHLVDPSATALAEAARRLSEVGLSDGRSLFLYKADVAAITGQLQTGGFDLIVANAALHHSARLDTVFRDLFTVLKPGGALIIGDWHNSVWLYPTHVHALLKSVDWPEKEAELHRFAATYELRRPPDEPKSLTVANQQIFRFWQAYARVRTASAPRFQVLEGHRPPADYSGLLHDCGFQDVGHRPIIDGSALLCVHRSVRPT